jgi:hypothetical protein
MPSPAQAANIASEFVSRATPDGYTIILLRGGHAVSAAPYRKLRFHPVDSFDFISLVGTFPFVVATRADGPIASLADVIATARQQPGKLSFSSVGFGSTQHLTGELLALSTALEQLAVKFNVSRERVRQIEACGDGGGLERLNRSSDIVQQVERLSRGFARINSTHRVLYAWSVSSYLNSSVRRNCRKRFSASGSKTMTVCVRNSAKRLGKPTPYVPKT